ncbi:MAG: GIY-YIG nuclease family protein [Lamprobacter sp.]|uniref:GIY-YIG nuclease family protein n=1 Tax=Lamprobacter sp. TaxID=3100796 RepID=UPI002B260D15|nr:GIY-YIG nuclease family protein [Lamprobacter sp.]MEA3638777.1 GIY-YIG nuclease family protein [Lamprobacter sp.]
MSELSDRELLDALGVESEPEQQTVHTPREERIIAGFEDIQRFYEEQGRIPQHGEDRDIFERLYAVRLERLMSLEECRTLLEPLDHQGLLKAQVSESESPQADALDDAALLAQLGVDDEAPAITELRHVRSTAEKKVAEEIANREPCDDFARFKPLFEQVQQDLDVGLRTARPFGKKAEIETGRFFILGGQKAYVAEMGEVFTQDYGDRDARLRVIFDNGTESNMLMRSLQRALTKDEAGRRITEPDAGPLFRQETEDGDQASGIIYVLRSQSDLPQIAENRELIHKIGVTSMEVEKRIAGAKLDPTFLMADVEIVATYQLYNINRAKLEHLIHRIFAPARLDIEIKDRFGNPVVPREWFLVPMYAIKDAVEKIQDGSITQYRYDSGEAKLSMR